MDDEDQKPANISSYLNYDWVPNNSYLDKNGQPTVPTVKLETDIGRQQFSHRVDGNRTEIGIECKQEDLTSHLDFSWLEHRRYEATMSSETIVTCESDKMKNDIPQNKDVIILSEYKEESLENHLDFDWLPPKRDATLAQSQSAVIDVIDLASSEYTGLGNVTKLKSPELAVINTFSEIASSKKSTGTAVLDNVNMVSSDEVDGIGVSNFSTSKSAMMNNFSPLQPAVTDSVSNLESLLSPNTDSVSNLAALRPAAIDNDSLEATLKSKSSDCFTNLSSSVSALKEEYTTFKEGKFVIKDNISRLSSYESTVLNNVGAVPSSESILIENITTLHSMKSVLTNDVSNLNPPKRFKSDAIEDVVDFVSRESLSKGSATTLLPFQSVVIKDVAALPSVESVNMDNVANVLSSESEIVPDVDNFTAVNSELCLESSEIPAIVDIETLCKKESSSLSASIDEPQSSSVTVSYQEVCSLNVSKHKSGSSSVFVCKQEPHPFSVGKQEPCSSPGCNQTTNVTAAACKDSDLYKNKCLEYNKINFKENQTLQSISSRNKCSRSDNIFEIMSTISDAPDETCRPHRRNKTTNVDNSNINRLDKRSFHKKAKTRLPLENNDWNVTQEEYKGQQLQFNKERNFECRAQSGEIKPTGSGDNNMFDIQMTALSNKKSDSTINISNESERPVNTPISNPVNTPISNVQPSPVMYDTESSSHNNDVEPDIVRKWQDNTVFGLKNEYSKEVKSDFSSSLMKQKGRWHVTLERLNAKSLVDLRNSKKTQENHVIECVDSKKEMHCSVSNCGLVIKIKKNNLDTSGGHASYGSNLEKSAKEVSFDPKITNVMHDDNSVKSSYHVNKDNEDVVNQNNCGMATEDECVNNETSCVTDVTDKEDEDMKNETSCMDKEDEDINNETILEMDIMDKEDEDMNTETNCVMDKEDEDMNIETNCVTDIMDKEVEEMNNETNCVMDKEDEDMNNETNCVMDIMDKDEVMNKGTNGVMDIMDKDDEDMNNERNCVMDIMDNKDDDINDDTCCVVGIFRRRSRQNAINCKGFYTQSCNEYSCEDGSSNGSHCSQSNSSDDSCNNNTKKKHIGIDKKRRRKKKLGRPWRLKGNVGSFCQFCPEYAAKNRTEMLRHIITTSHLMQRFGKKSFVTKKFECNVCSTRFSNKKSFFRHYRKYHVKFAAEGDTEECTWCIHYRDLDVNDLTDPILSKQHQVLKDHYSSHIARSRTTISREDNCCDICNKTFTSKQTLEEHIPTHFENYNNICLLCNENCHDRNKLIRHILTHFEANVNRDTIPYGYDTCRENESNHNESEIDKKPFSEIWKVLSWKKDKSNKKYPAEVECKTCPNFTTESFTLMLLHERMTFHVRTKFGASGLAYLKYECPVFSARYKRSDNLKGHLKSKHMPKTARAGSKDIENEEYTNPSKRQKIILSETQNYVTDSSEEKRKNTLVCGSGKKEDISRSESQILKCDMCFEILSSKQSFKDHIRTHFHMTSFKCELCKQLFPNREDLIKHLLNHDTIEQNCDLCEQRFSTLDDLRIHRISCHRIQGNERPSCDLVTGSTRQNDINCEYLGTPGCVSENSEDSSDQKNNCSQGNTSDESCNTNYNKAHIQRTKKRRRKGTQEKNIDIFCECCPEYMAKNKKEMSRHESTTSHLIRRFGKTSLETKPYECNVCSARFIRKQSLIVDHYENYHGKYVVEGDTMECTWCNYYRDLHVDVKKSQKCRVLKKHVCSHIARSRAKITFEDNCCDICKTTFTSKQTLDEHIPTHFENYNNICMLCNEDCQNRNDLVHHIPAHFEAHLNKDTIPFKYDTCSENDSNDKVRIDKIPFTESWNVLTWKRENSYKKCPNKVKCKTCPNFTTTSWNLMKLHERMTFHIRTKFGESRLKSFRYECPMCSARYTRANSYREHFKAKHVPRVSEDDRKSPENECNPRKRQNISVNEEENYDTDNSKAKKENTSTPAPEKEENTLIPAPHEEEDTSTPAPVEEENTSIPAPREKKNACIPASGKKGNTSIPVSEEKENTLIPASEILKCDMCFEILSSKQSFNDHIQTHFQMKSFKCELCKHEFPDRDELTKHLLNHDTGGEQCDLCERRFYTVDELRHHRTFYHRMSGEKRFPCEQCSEVFKTEKGLNSHIKRVHIDKAYACEHCGKLFRHKDRLEVHTIGVHTKQFKFRCHICGKGLFFQAALDDHLKQHEGIERFECKICGEKFSARWKKCKHMRDHKLEERKNKPELMLACDICGKKFVQKIRLKQHLYVHAGKKTFKCEICGRFFARSDNLVTHKRTHTGHKPYSCDTCGKEFARVDNLKTHIRKMHF